MGLVSADFMAIQNDVGRTWAIYNSIRDVGVLDTALLGILQGVLGDWALGISQNGFVA